MSNTSDKLFDPKAVRIGDDVYIHATGRPYAYRYIVESKSPRGRLMLRDTALRYTKIEIDSLGQIVGRKPNDPRHIVSEEEAKCIENRSKTQVQRAQILNALRVVSDNMMSASKEELTAMLKEINKHIKKL